MKAPEFLFTLTPSVRTSAGKRGSARLTRFCTSTAAKSKSRVGAKVTTTLDEPSFEDDDVMYCMPGTPFSSCSRGIVTDASTSAALAPTKYASTSTRGGSIFGYCAIGRPGITTAPAITSSSAHTLANTTRRMKKSTNMSMRRRGFRGGSRGGARRGWHAYANGRAVVQLLQLAHDQAVTGHETALHVVVVVFQRAE